MLIINTIIVFYVFYYVEQVGPSSLMSVKRDKGGIMTCDVCGYKTTVSMVCQ